MAEMKDQADNRTPGLSAHSATYWLGVVPMCHFGPPASTPTASGSSIPKLPLEELPSPTPCAGIVAIPFALTGRSEYPFPPATGVGSGMDVFANSEPKGTFRDC